MTFVDTNYFIRFLLNDIPKQHLKAKKLFEEGLSGKKTLFTSVIVFFELYWVFSSYYEKDKDEIISILTNVLNLTFIEFENYEFLVAALDLFSESKVELEDCYNVRYFKSQKGKDFATFDKKLLKPNLL